MSEEKIPCNKTNCATVHLYNTTSVPVDIHIKNKQIKNLSSKDGHAIFVPRGEDISIKVDNNNLEYNVKDHLGNAQNQKVFIVEKEADSYDLVDFNCKVPCGDTKAEHSKIKTLLGNGRFDNLTDKSSIQGVITGSDVGEEPELSGGGKKSKRKKRKKKKSTKRKKKKHTKKYRKSKRKSKRRSKRR